MSMEACGCPWKKNDRSFDKVAPRIVLGRLLWQVPKVANTPPINMVIDLTAEWSEPLKLRSVKRYLSVPVVDTTVPTVEQVAETVQQALMFLEDPNAGSIYIHCANGYGRSALVAAAVLLYNGSCNSPTCAKEWLLRARPVVSLGARKLNLLQDVMDDMEPISDESTAEPSSSDDELCR